MANNPNILTFGLPEKEEALLRKCLEADECVASKIEIHRSLSALLSQPVSLRGELRNGVQLVILDRTYNIAAHTYGPKGVDPFSFGEQLACVRMWFPRAQVVCATNSPLLFKREQGGLAFDPHFIGAAAYASLHQNLSFGTATQK